MKRLPFALILAPALAGAGCEPGNDREHALECFSIQDCPSGLVCFLGACVEPNYQVTSVYAEMTPPASSSYLSQAVRDPFDLSQGLIEMSVQTSVLVAGSFTAEDGGLFCDSGTVTAKAASGIPGRETVRQAAVSLSSFNLSVVPDAYALSFVSNQGGPPLDFVAQAFIDDTAWNQAYPAQARWVKVHGRVRFNPETAPNVGGALVTGTAAGGGGLDLRSTSTLTDSNGEYLLSFPPGAEVFCITVGPGTNLLVPETTKCGLTLAAPDGYVDDVVLGLLNKVTVAAAVKDADGQGVGRANVVFEGLVGDGIFTTRGDTTEAGDVKQGDPNNSHNPELWPGDYTVTVAPNKTDPWALTTASVVITSGEPVTLYVGRKVQLSGSVRAFDGTLVAGANLTVTRRGVAVPREFTTATASDGTYALAIDPGDANADAEYELTVQPDLKSRLPYFRELLRVGATEVVRDVRLYDSTLAAGRVWDPGGTPLAEVIIGFYSIELGSAQQALLVGIGRTNDLGEFVVPLPQLSAP